jgi:ABC-type oligopeptide transport system ATPase subunit
MAKTLEAQIAYKLSIFLDINTGFFKDRGRPCKWCFISHSLPVVAQLATWIAVMRTGKFVEVGAAEQILRKPAHPYTRELLAAVPELLWA